MPRIVADGLSMKDTRSNKTVQATPMNVAVLSLKAPADSCHRYGVPDLIR
jgi:hypothetical protein